MTNLSINLNKFALLRNSRGHNVPSVLEIGRRCLTGGAQGLTLHQRPDQRHSLYSDVRELSLMVRDHKSAELNIEGAPIDPFMDVVLQSRPHQCTLVPDAPDQLTSDHGWDIESNMNGLQRAIQRLHDAGVRVSLFVDPVISQIKAAAQVGADRIELYTAAYAKAFGTDQHAEMIQTYRAASEEASELGLGVNAGHDLNLLNLSSFLRGVPNVLEISVGHAFICEALDYTLDGTLQRYLAVTKERIS